MKRAFVVTLIAVAGLVVRPVGAGSQTQALPTTDQIIEKCITAMGGRAAIEKITSRVSKGTLEVPDMGVQGTVTVSEKAPDKTLTVLEMNGMFVREGTDTAGAWEDNPQTGLRDKTGTELADARRAATFSPELRLREMYKTLEVTGQEKVGDKDAYVVLATPAVGAPSRLYFDVASGLMVRQTGTRESAQGPVDVDVYLDDFRTVDGIKLPFAIHQVTAAFSVDVRLSEVTHNVALDDALFKRPGTR
jgi:hypothetical protein